MECTLIVDRLNSSQEETDTRIILYCQYAEEEGYRSCKVRSPDTDVFFILLYYAHVFEKLTLFFDTGTGNNRRLLDITELSAGFNPNVRAAVMAVHAFSGCDTTSAFKGIGKIRPIKLLMSSQQYCEAFTKLGETSSVSDDVCNSLDSFTCALYGKSRVNKVDVLRHTKISDLCPDGGLPSKTVDFTSFPPCRRSLDEHIKRVNFQVGIWKLVLELNPELPDATGMVGL